MSSAQYEFLAKLTALPPSKTAALLVALRRHGTDSAWIHAVSAERHGVHYILRQSDSPYPVVAGAVSTPMADGVVRLDCFHRHAYIWQHCENPEYSLSVTDAMVMLIRHCADLGDLPGKLPAA